MCPATRNTASEEKFIEDFPDNTSQVKACLKFLHVTGIAGHKAPPGRPLPLMVINHLALNRDSALEKLRHSGFFRNDGLMDYSG